MTLLLEKKPGRRKLPAGKAKELYALKDRYSAWLIASNFSDCSLKGAHFTLLVLFRWLEGQGVLRVADVTADVLHGYAQHWHERRLREKVSVLHVKNNLGWVKRFFRWAFKSGHVLCNPALELEIPRAPSQLPHTILTQDEVQRLLSAHDLSEPVGYRDKTMIELIYATGIRQGEMRRLKVEDVDLKDRTITIRKGKPKKDRITPVPRLTAGYLREYIEKVRPRFVPVSLGGNGDKARSDIPGEAPEDNGLLFLTWTGRHLYQGAVSLLYRRAAKKAGIDKRVSSMVLRHSIASHLLENGMSIRYIQEFLGHERMSTTENYTKVTLTGLRKMYNKFHPRENRGRKRSVEA